jgi:beta-galactosidase
MVRLGDQTLPARLWRETIETALDPVATFADGGPAWVRQGRWNYLATWPEAALFDAVIERLGKDAGLFISTLEEGVRLRTRDGVAFAFNFAPEPRVAPAPAKARFVLGGAEMAPGGVSAWRLD